MKISVKSEYACLALVYLSKIFKDEKLATIKKISKENNIPKKYLEQILLILKRNGYLKSYRGKNGGYTLSKEPAEITLAEIIRLMDGALAPVNSVSSHFFDHTPIERNKPILSVFQEIRDFISDKLENLTFEDMV